MIFDFKALRHVAAAVLICGFGLTHSSLASADCVDWDDTLPIVTPIVAFGPEVPFPLSADFPFPWTTIEGIWEAKSPQFSGRFSFEVQTDSNGRKVLRVVELDPAKNTMMSEGTGIGVDDYNMVRAAMSGSAGNYMLYIGAFRNPAKAAKQRTITVLTLRPFDSMNDDDTQVVVNKISNRPYRSPGATLAKTRTVR